MKKVTMILCVLVCSLASSNVFIFGNNQELRKYEEIIEKAITGVTLYNGISMGFSPFGNIGDNFEALFETIHQIVHGNDGLFPAEDVRIFIKMHTKKNYNTAIKKLRSTYQ